MAPAARTRSLNLATACQRTDNGHGWQPVGNMHLNLNRNGLNSAKRHCLDAGMHAACPILTDGHDGQVAAVPQVS